MKVDPIIKMSAVVIVLFLMTVAILFLLNMISQAQLMDLSLKFLVLVGVLGIGSFLIKLIAFGVTRSDKS